MSDETVVRFENVSKRFVFTAETPQSILETVISFFSHRHRAQRNRELWAVRDVSFEVESGQAIGIIGRNGSGKSTLLKLITRILRPNKGRIMINGRISALLELGAGFHPDLTGRENIFLNAAVLGISKEDVAARYDDIVGFSELGDYINMPVKHYSSGMYMRLGFSVAIHVNPDILIVDEILAVGDQAFQTKCLDRIHDMKRQGVTIIMVSHNLSVMQHLCSHLIWLENGKVQQIGLVDEVARQYQAYSERRGVQQMQRVESEYGFKRMGNGEIEITAVRILDKDGAEKKIFKTGDEMVVEMDFVVHKPIPDPEFGLAIHRDDGVHINGPNTRIAGLEMGMVEGAGIIRYSIPTLPLMPARYLLTTAVHDSRYAYTYDYHEQAYAFRVIPGGTNEQWGAIEIPAVWEWRQDPIQTIQ